jgi:hypothetical protein
MKKMMLLLLAIGIFTGCEKYAYLDTGKSVNLMTNNNPTVFNKSVILYNKNDFSIKTPLDTFLLGYPFRWGGYDDMKTKAINDGKTKDILIVSDYLKYHSDSLFILAYYLENGNCLVLDKKSNQIVKSVQVVNWFEGKPMQSMGGRRFYIDNTLFLQIVDIVSK